MYSGQANYLEDKSSGLGTLSIDWKKTDSKFGFFSVFSDKDECASKSYTKSLTYGPRKA